MRYPQFIDNTRKNLADVLREIAPNYNTLSIATGYWDLAGTMEIIDQLEEYQSIRLLIGKEPIAHRYQEKFQIDMESPENLFPDAEIRYDLEKDGASNEINEMRETVKKMVKLIEENRMQVKVYRYPRLHAKAYVFGSLGDGNSIGIIGSSNFTRAGLTTNSELNFLSSDYKIVEFEPKSLNQENGHLTWFNDLWNAEEAEDWTGDFVKILKDSSIGEYTFGPYDVYIRTLMEVFPDELIETTPFDDQIENILFSFQNQNALSLRRKLQNMGVAMLSDSVGLGKTITAAAIIKQYLDDGLDHIVILPPAALKRQWKDELEGDRWNLVEGRDFKIISQQDGRTIQDLLEFSIKSKNTRNEVDLFVIDEAHNLRNQSSVRYQQVLTLLQENPNAKVLLLTATPINNSLMDFANQIQLGSKGDLISRNVPYISKKGSQLEYIDFFEALRRIQSEATRAEKRGEKFDWEHHQNTLMTGIRHYLVRSTRQGMKKNAMKHENDETIIFPKSKVDQFKYGYHQHDENYIYELLKLNASTVFEGFHPERLDLGIVGEFTQRTAHPLDLFKQAVEAEKQGKKDFFHEKFDMPESSNGLILFSDEVNDLSVIPAIFSMINFLGFASYKPETYNYRFYNKSVADIRALGMKGHEANRIRLQMGIHKMLHVTWLKRLESSTATLLKSVGNYLTRMRMFEKWLDEGYIVSLADADLLVKEYDEDIEKAFDDYNAYLEELNESIKNGKDKEVQQYGVERRVADDSVYNIEQLRKDIERDRKICKLIVAALQRLSQKEHDGKIEIFAQELVKTLESKKYGKKVLVFSFFSDTIDYLKEQLPIVLEERIPKFRERSAFVSGGTGKIEDIAKRFSPVSKKYQLKSEETEIDFLFATDVLSEGQNLQDAGILVNYDLHWNPVRMIQRNGRINRLGSKYNEILIANAIPHDDLELYLKLVRRLENKIATINNTIGNDQSVLGETENPIEFNDLTDAKSIYDSDSTRATEALEKLENQGDMLDWVDSYSFELRNFLDEHKDDGEVERLLNIPKGKWNYLPNMKDGSVGTSTEILALFRAQGQYSSTGEKIHDVGFVSIDKQANRGPFSAVRAEYIQEQEALARIRATPEDNNRIIDEIQVDRETYIASGRTEIKVQFESDKPIYDVDKPSRVKALGVLKDYFPEELNLLSIIENNIRRSNEKREFERIVLKVNREVKEDGNPYATTVKRFEKFLNKLMETEAKEKRLENIEGVFYYAEPK